MTYKITVLLASLLLLSGFNAHLAYAQCVAWNLWNATVKFEDGSVGSGYSSSGCSEGSYDISQARDNPRAFIARKLCSGFTCTVISYSGHVTLSTLHCGFSTKGSTIGCGACSSQCSRCCRNRPLHRFRCRLRRRAASCNATSHRRKTSYAATCTFGCGNGQSITTTGYGSTPAAARTNSEGRASIYCAPRGGITSYGNCSIYP